MGCSSSAGSFAFAELKIKENTTVQRDKIIIEITLLNDYRTHARQTCVNTKQ